MKCQSTEKSDMQISARIFRFPPTSGFF